MSILTDISPSDLGFSPKFAEFREIQAQLVEWAVYGDPDLGKRRFMIMGAAGGSGKTLVCQTIARMTGMKTVVLTATRGLEDQILNDGFNLVDIRGKQNYECNTYNRFLPDKRWTCDEGDDIECEDVGTKRCTYQIQADQAKRSRVILTNYAYWMHARKMSQTALEDSVHGPVKLLILDEAHLAVNQLRLLLGAWIANADIHRWADAEIKATLRLAHGADNGVVSKSWIETLATYIVRVDQRLSEISQEYLSDGEAYRKSKEYRRLSKLVDSAERVIAHAEDGNWLWQETKSGIRFDCIWPAKYAKKYLFSGVENVLLVSATARPKLARLLGIGRDEMLFKEWPRVFPAVNSPVIHVPTGKMGKKANEDERLKSVKTLDEFLDLGWINVKGIIHTASYPRAEWVQANSKYGSVMLLNKRGESADEMAERFRRAPPPSILVSPSYGTGFDFDLVDQQEWSWQFIIKMPFADKSDPIVDAMIKTDPDWYGYDTMQTFCQSCWRLVRRPTAKCVTIVTDNAVKFLMMTAADHKPRWFSVQTRPTLPLPPIELRHKLPVKEYADQVLTRLSNDDLRKRQQHQRGPLPPPEPSFVGVIQDDFTDDIPF